MGVQYKWREVCSVENEQEGTSSSEPAGFFRGFSPLLPMSSSFLVVYTHLVFVEKVAFLFMVELYVNGFAGYVVQCALISWSRYRRGRIKNFFIGNCHGIVSSDSENLEKNIP